MKFDIIFENEDLIVVDKPAGLVVNRSITNRDETLQDQLVKYLELGSGDLGIGERAGIVHRLDRETSGIMLVAKTQKAFENLQEQFKNRQVQKEYIALVHGQLAQKIVLVKNKIARIGKFGKFGVVLPRSEGRESETEIVKISNFKFQISNFQKITESGDFNKPRTRYLEKNATVYSLVCAFPKTGRTHQIRVHAKSIGHPVVGDSIYLPNKLLKFDTLWCPRLFLHAAKIKFIDPGGRREMEFEAVMPAELKAVLDYLQPVV